MDHAAHRYPRTILLFHVSPPFEVDLRRAVRPGAVRRLRGLGLGARFGVVTPFNPGGRPLGAARNRRRLSVLALGLARSGLAQVPADGLSIDRRHAERGFAIKASRARLVALARSFGQTAIFWFDGRRFLLVWCSRPARGTPLPEPQTPGLRD